MASFFTVVFVIHATADFAPHGNLRAYLGPTSSMHNRMGGFASDSYPGKWRSRDLGLGGPGAVVRGGPLPGPPPPAVHRRGRSVGRRAPPPAGARARARTRVLFILVAW